MVSRVSHPALVGPEHLGSWWYAVNHEWLPRSAPLSLFRGSGAFCVSVFCWGSSRGWRCSIELGWTVYPYQCILISDSGVRPFGAGWLLRNGIRWLRLLRFTGKTAGTSDCAVGPLPFEWNSEFQMEGSILLGWARLYGACPSSLPTLTQMNNS